MIYCKCYECGFQFQKGSLRNPKCFRCGNPKLELEDVPSSDISASMRAADRIFREWLSKHPEVLA